MLAVFVTYHYFLGLRNLTVISETQRMVRETKDPNFSIEEIPLDDKAVYTMLSQGKGEGIFQFESGGMKDVLSRLKPEKIEDLIAVISLYRPGPMDSIPTYIENRHNPEKITYMHPKLEPILRVTYGCIVYQEQVMQIFRSLAGYSFGRADLVRRAMAKKKADVMQKEREYFINGKLDENGNVEVLGCVKNGVSAKVAEEIFNQMSSFASYAFNKSHAAAYALLAYQTAYLKAHYPLQFMAALITSVLDNTSKIVEYIGECSKNSIKVLPPDINQSCEKFTVDGNAIRFGLLGIKNVGEGFVKELVAERENNGKFTSFTDFSTRMSDKCINKKLVENLIKCGAFDCFPNNRRELLLGYEEVMRRESENLKFRQSGQMNLFDSVSEDVSDDFVKYDDFTLEQRLEMEKEVAGVYVSGHPVEKYSAIFKSGVAKLIADINEAVETGKLKEGDRVSVLACIENISIKKTKTGDSMAFAACEDTSAQTEVVIFPKVFALSRKKLEKNVIIFVRGKISIREDEPVKIIADSILDPDTVSTQSSNSGVYIRFPSSSDPRQKQIEEIVSTCGGNVDTYFYFEDTKKLIRLPQTMLSRTDDTFLEHIRKILGEKNVAIKN